MVEPVCLFVGCLFAAEDRHDEAVTMLAKDFGPPEVNSPHLLWDRSDYYRSELGPCIFRSFLFFGRVVDSSALAEVKLKTARVEAELAREHKRTVNLDPGYISLAKVVLASRKNYSHRINLGQGVFAETELIYCRGEYHPMPYTYGDYREPAVLKIFAEARRLFRTRLAEAARGCTRRLPGGPPRGL
jgi:hypothetical protein